ncbi:MAG: hypothetical protein K2I66_04250 [Bacteroidales bacterium]|nr:hypothetical protein [Bacteroidales bacterium]
MKGLGIFFLVIAGFNLVMSIIAIANGVHIPIAGGLTFGVLGAFLVSRANRKKKAAEAKEKWENENKDAIDKIY